MVLFTRTTYLSFFFLYHPKIFSDVSVGTPEYISPEVLQAQQGGFSHGKDCDWWALGIMMYEILYGEVPFYSESLLQMYGMIMDHKKHLKFPDDPPVSDDAKDLMRKSILLPSFGSSLLIGRICMTLTLLLD